MLKCEVIGIFELIAHHDHCWRIVLSVTLKSLPFDEKNQLDFDEMTERIRTALDAIRKNKSLKATQNTLAKLAHCSRRTLSLRRWPVEELKRIKNQRNPEPAEIKSVASAKRILRTTQSEAQLIGQVRTYQAQNGTLFDRIQGLEEDKSRSALIQTTLEAQLSGARETIHELEMELRRTKLKAVKAK
jgi:hypothetical protein